jgi:hypothetical protein
MGFIICETLPGDEAISRVTCTTSERYLNVIIIFELYFKLYRMIVLNVL